MKYGDIKYITLHPGPGQEKLEIPLYPDKGLSGYITLKDAGNFTFRKEAGLKNREIYFEKCGIDSHRFFSLYQVHSKDVVLVEEKSAVADICSIKADGLITRRTGARLGVTAADCLPIFLYDGKTGGFGVVHSGWKGTGIAMNAICLMETEWGSRPGDLKCVIGPGIGSCCYHVPRERAGFFSGNYGNGVVKNVKDVYYLDLKKANVNILTEAGVGDITVVENCTSCDSGFHSFRRDGASFQLMLAYAGYFL